MRSCAVAQTHCAGKGSGPKQPIQSRLRLWAGSEVEVNFKCASSWASTSCMSLEPRGHEAAHFQSQAAGEEQSEEAGCAVPMQLPSPHCRFVEVLCQFKAKMAKQLTLMKYTAEAEAL